MSRIICVVGAAAVWPDGEVHQQEHVRKGTFHALQYNSLYSPQNPPPPPPASVTLNTSNQNYTRGRERFPKHGPWMPWMPLTSTFANLGRLIFSPALSGGYNKGGGWPAVACRPRGRTRISLCGILMYIVSGQRACVGATRGEPVPMVTCGNRDQPSGEHPLRFA